MGIIGDIAGVVGSIVSAGDKKKELAFKEAQYRAQQALADRQQQLAEQLARQGIATRIDGSGNIVAYDKGTNTWRTVLSPEQKQLQNASDAEHLKEIGVDATAARNERTQAASARVGESQTAAALRQRIMDSFSGKGSVDPYRVSQSEELSNKRAIAAGDNQVGAELGTEALRGGSNNVQQVGAALARARSQQIADTMGNPELKGLLASRQLNEGRQNADVGAFTQFADRAANVDNAPFNPVNITATLRGDQSDAAGNSLNATANAGVGIARAAQGLTSALKENGPDYYQYSQGPSIAGIGRGIDTTLQDIAAAVAGGGGGGGDPMSMLLQQLSKNRTADAGGSSNGTGTGGGDGYF